MNYVNRYSILINTGVIGGAKCNKFIWEYPVKITILYSFIMLVFVEVKFLVIEPAEPDRILETP